MFFPLLLIPSSRDISPTPIIQRLSSSSSCLPPLPERAAFPPLHSSRTVNERNYGESLQTPHGFLNDGRRRGFQFERKLVEDKLVMKIHEEAGSVPNERIEIKSTDLIRHRPTRGRVIIILYRSVL